jgi:hypothetical protein
MTAPKYTLFFEDEADEAVSRLEDDPRQARACAAVKNLLIRLAADPFDARLHTEIRPTARWGNASLTHAPGTDDWYILWKETPDADNEIDVIHVLEIILRRR